MELKNILISQPLPKGTSPYTDIESRYGVKVDFQPFFRVEGVSKRDFVAQRVSVLDYTAVVFSSRTAIDSYFSLCEQTRTVVPESMKYFCQSEAIALYLQKYIVYRKRKIFFGNGTLPSVIEMIGTKHKNEKFLIACNDALRPEVGKLFAKAKLEYGSVVLVRTVNNDLKELDLSKYQMVVFYSPNDIKSLQENFPGFAQGDVLFATYGSSTAKAMAQAGLKVEISAPTPEAPSIAQALTLYLSAK